MFMRNIGSIIVIALITAVVTLGMEKLVLRENHQDKAPTAAAETTFDKIVRTGTLRCGYIVWPPFITIDPNTKHKSGISYDLMNAIGHYLNLKIEWTEEVLAGQNVTAIDAKRVDMICSAESPLDPATNKVIEFSAPFAYYPIDAYTRTDDLRFDNNREAFNSADVTLAIMDGDLTEVLARRDYPQAKTDQLPNSADPQQLMLDVVNHKADVVFMDPITLATFLKANPGTLRKVQLPQPIVIYPWAVSMQKGDYRLRELIDRGIEALQSTGELDRILHKYDPDGTQSYLLRKPYLEKP